MKRSVASRGRASRGRLTRFISFLLLLLALALGVSWLVGMLQVRREPAAKEPPHEKQYIWKGVERGGIRCRGQWKALKTGQL
jgi:lipopolysaccharide export system protein LptC